MALYKCGGGANLTSSVLVGSASPFSADHRGVYMAISARTKFTNVAHNTMTTTGTAIADMYIDAPSVDGTQGVATAMIAVLNKGDTITQAQGNYGYIRIYEVK